MRSLDILSFIQAISIAPLQSTTQRRSQQSTDDVSEFQAEASAASQATASEELAKGPYVAPWPLERDSNSQPFG